MTSDIYVSDALWLLCDYIKSSGILSLQNKKYNEAQRKKPWKGQFSPSIRMYTTKSKVYAQK